MPNLAWIMDGELTVPLHSDNRGSNPITFFIFFSILVNSSIGLLTKLIQVLHEYRVEGSLVNRNEP